MSKMSTVQVDNMIVEIHGFRGEVIDEKKWSTTHISGGGGGGSITQGSGTISTAPITSTVEVHDQFFLRNGSKEVAMNLSNANFAIRKGHDVSVFWGIPSNKPAGPYIAAHNNTTGQTVYFDPNLQQLAGRTVLIGTLIFLMIAAGLVIFVVCGYQFFNRRGGFTFGDVLGLVIGCGAIWVGWRMRAARRARVHALAAAIGPAIKSLPAMDQSVS
jgi:hypothetical protein